MPNRTDEPADDTNHTAQTPGDESIVARVRVRVANLPGAYGQSGPVFSVGTGGLDPGERVGLLNDSDGPGIDTESILLRLCRPVITEIEERGYSPRDYQVDSHEFLSVLWAIVEADPFDDENDPDEWLSVEEIPPADRQREQLDPYDEDEDDLPPGGDLPDGGDA